MRGAFVVAWVLVASTALAAHPSTLEPRLVPMSTAQRSSVLEQQLLTESRDATVWYLTWGLTWTALSIGQLASFPFDRPEERPSYVAWSIGSVFGTVMEWVLKPELVSPPLLQRARAVGVDDATRLALLEEQWVRSHAEETEARAWWQQLICVGTNVVPFAVVAIGWKRFDWLYLVGGILLSELQIFTFPQLLLRFGVGPRTVEALF